MIRAPIRQRAPTGRLAQLAVVLAAATALVLAALLSGEFRSEFGRAASILSRGEADAVRDDLRSFGSWGPVASILLMVLQALIAPIPAFLVVFANGLAYGVVWGGLLSLAGQTLAAVICFSLARALGRAPVEALVGKLGVESADRWFARWGLYGILVSRLVPGIGFDAVSYAAGLTRVGLGRFAVATVVGAAPQTFVYSYLGQCAPQFAWALLAVTVLVLGGVAAVAFRQRRRQRREEVTDRANTASKPAALLTKVVVEHGTDGSHRDRREPGRPPRATSLNAVQMVTVPGGSRR